MITGCSTGIGRATANLLPWGGEHGRIDALVNNAGNAVQGDVEEVPVADVSAMFDVNVFGLLRMVRAAAPYMRARGHIVNVSSIAGRLSTPRLVYSASTFAVAALSDALRLEFAPFGVKVSVIEPGAIAPGSTRRSAGSPSDA